MTATNWQTNRLVHECLELYVTARGGAISYDEQATFVAHVLPLAQAAIHSDRLIKSQDKLIRKAADDARAQHKAEKRAVKQRRVDVQKSNGTYRRPMSDTGWANGYDPLASYSAQPYWHRPGGRPRGQQEN